MYLVVALETNGRQVTVRRVYFFNSLCYQKCCPIHRLTESIITSFGMT